MIYFCSTILRRGLNVFQILVGLCWTHLLPPSLWTPRNGCSQISTPLRNRTFSAFFIGAWFDIRFFASRTSHTPRSHLKPAHSPPLRIPPSSPQLRRLPFSAQTPKTFSGTRSLGTKQQLRRLTIVLSSLLMTLFDVLYSHDTIVADSFSLPIDLSLICCIFLDALRIKNESIDRYSKFRVLWAFLSSSSNSAIKQSTA